MNRQSAVYTAPEDTEDEEYYDEEAEGEEGEAAPDPLAELTAEQRAAVEAREQQLLTQLQQDLGNVGIALTRDRKPAVADRNRAMQYLGVREQQAEARAQAQGQTAAPAPEEEADDADIPDPVYAAREHRAWVDKRVERTLSKAVSPLVEELKNLRTAQVETRIDRAFSQVQDAVENHSPWMAGVLEHPQFEDAFREALANIDPAQWRTPHGLAAVVGMVAPYLPLEMMPAAAQPPPRRGTTRNPETGQFQPVRRPRGAGQQAAAAQVAPSREAGRRPRQAEDDDAIKRFVEMGYGTVEEARALANSADGDDYLSAKKKRLEGLK